jgi:hypothetical protein
MLSVSCAKVRLLLHEASNAMSESCMRWFMMNFYHGRRRQSSNNNNIGKGTGLVVFGDWLLLFFGDGIMMSEDIKLKPTPKLLCLSEAVLRDIVLRHPDLPTA